MSATTQDDVKRVDDALSQLSTDISLLNTRYLRCLAVDEPTKATDLESLQGKPAIVFLRHEEVDVFAISLQGQKGDTIATANSVIIRNVTFVVDETGRQQTLNKQGPLPNRRTIHAFLTGILETVSDEAIEPDTSLWEPVSYNPVLSGSFVYRETKAPIAASRTALLVPGKCKVWVPNANNRAAAPQPEA